LEELRDWRENGGEERREIRWMKQRGEFCCPSAVYCVAHADLYQISLSTPQ